MPRRDADGRAVRAAHRLSPGEPVQYLSATHGRWIAATVERVHSDGSVSLDIKPRADPARVQPRSALIESRAFRVGEQVEYLSKSRQRWISATVERVHTDGSVTLDFGAASADAEGATSNPLHGDRDRDRGRSRSRSRSRDRGRSRSRSPRRENADETAPLVGDDARLTLSPRASPRAVDDSDSEATIWIKGHPDEEWNGLYRRDFVYHDWPVYVNEKDAKALKYCYRSEDQDTKGAGRDRWFLNEKHTPNTNSCAAYIDSAKGPLPTGAHSWKCVIDDKWVERTVTVDALVRPSHAPESSTCACSSFFSLRRRRRRVSSGYSSGLTAPKRAQSPRPRRRRMSAWPEGLSGATA